MKFYVSSNLDWIISFQLSMCLSATMSVDKIWLITQAQTCLRPNYYRLPLLCLVVVPFQCRHFLRLSLSDSQYFLCHHHNLPHLPPIPLHFVVVSPPSCLLLLWAQWSWSHGGGRPVSHYHRVPWAQIAPPCHHRWGKICFLKPTPNPS